MKFLATALLAACFIAPAMGEELNTKCACGKDANPEITVEVKVDDEAHKVAVCCEACGEVVKKDPKAALEKIKAAEEKPAEAKAE
jgi:hypothetical protein